MKRSREEFWMAAALDQARAAAAAGEVPVGAVLLREEELVCAERNRMIELGDPTAHAEILALREGARMTGNYRLSGCELFVTVEPCPMCAGAAVLARISRLVFGCADEKTGAAGSVYDIARDERLNHLIEVKKGVLEEECRELLKDFFRARR